MKASFTSAKLELPPTPTPRSKGVHASGVIRAIATEMGILGKPEWMDVPSMADQREITDPTAILRICIGLAWEEWYILNILFTQGVIKHPGEMFLDDIYMSPDGESVDVIITSGKHMVVTIIHEVKATYKSINTVSDLSSQWLWLSQVKAYCKGANTRFARLHILYLCGDYKYPLKPQLHVWDLEFTQKEIDDNWQLLSDYKNFREAK
ncbi:hypothetical protein KGP36_03410 [Patescibacteria group bacterium]|nr:hypothetical protein [Patescibacteria group bacterium]